MNTSLKRSSPIYFMKFPHKAASYRVYRCFVIFPLGEEVPVYRYCRDSKVNLFFIDSAAFLVTLWGLTNFRVSLELIVCVLE